MEVDYKYQSVIGFFDESVFEVLKTAKDLSGLERVLVIRKIL